MIFPAVLLLAASLVMASKDLQPANKSSTSWACPEYALGFNGFDITYNDNIPSWQECGRLCHVHKTCSHWEWNHPRSHYVPRRCWLKTGDGGAGYFVDTISG